VFKTTDAIIIQKGIDMSRLPKKKSRSIIIDGRKFRWILSGKNPQGGSPVIINLSIQEDLEKPGQTLQCVLKATKTFKAQDYHFDEYEYCSASVIPSDIEKVIKVGLASGWTPAKGSGTFHPGNLILSQYTIYSSK
jgi:hypothetical protein